MVLALYFKHMKDIILSTFTIIFLLLLLGLSFIKKHNLKDCDKKDSITNHQNK
jgi:preprotein translocase subunit SecG